jgi:hypothetical protein
MFSSPKASKLLSIVLCVHLVHGFVVQKTPCCHARHNTRTCTGATVPLRSTADDEDEITVNPIVAAVKVSKTVEVFGLVKQMEAEGETVTSLCVGEPDFPPPKAVLEAAMAAITGGETRYTAVTGTADLRNAIANDLKRRKGLDYNPQTEIVVGNGVSSEAVLVLACLRERKGSPTSMYLTSGETISLSRTFGYIWAWGCSDYTGTILAVISRNGLSSRRPTCHRRNNRRKWISLNT